MGEMSRATQALRAARKIVFFTGTGISAESGIPTFGDKLTGHWTKHDVLPLHGSLATPICFACKRPANLINEQTAISCEFELVCMDESLMRQLPHSQRQRITKNAPQSGKTPTVGAFTTVNQLDMKAVTAI